MKIAVSGAHRVGKSTLIEKILESLPEYTSKPEAYFELEEAGYDFSATPTLDDYLAQLEHSIEQIISNEGNVIFDRCPVDMLAYIQTAGEFENFNIQSLYHRVQHIMTEIDLIVFVPIEEPDVIDCPESELPGIRHQVNELLNEWIWDFEIKVIEVRGSPTVRRDQVLNYISTKRI